MIKPGACIGSGGCAAVYEWGDDQVIKLFYSNTTREAVFNEYRNSAAAWEAGLPVVKPYELIDYVGSPGIIYERIIGESIKDRLFLPAHIDRNVSFDNNDGDVRVMARLLYTIHQTKKVPNLNKQRDDLKRSIGWPPYLSDKEKQHIFTYLDTLPEGNRLCHGDPNPGNYMIRNGKPVMIDWMNATIGNPIADVVEFVLIFQTYVLPPETPPFFLKSFQTYRETINEIFLDEYRKLSGITSEEIDAWILPIAARKLSADSASEEEKMHLITIIRQRLSRLESDSQLYK